MANENLKLTFYVDVPHYVRQETVNQIYATVNPSVLSSVFPGTRRYKVSFEVPNPIEYHEEAEPVVAEVFE